MKMMAVEAERFSIREYTAKMRAVDVEKGWPFSGGGGKPNGSGINKEQVDAFLPPITVAKFRWWSHELNKIQQQQEQDIVGIPIYETKKKEESLDIFCPVCGNFLAASMKAVHAHVDTCLAHAEREEKAKMRMPMKPKSKSKSKSPKKRSILEIFAVSPLIDKVADENGHSKKDESPCGQENGVIKTKHRDQKKSKIKIKKKLKKALMASQLTMDQKKNKIKKKKTKKKTKNDYKSSTTNKDNAHKLQSSIPVNCSRKLDASFCNKGIVEGTSDGFSLHGNNSGLGVSVEKQHGVIASKYVVKHQKAAIPVRGILKNHSKLISQKDSDICDMPGGKMICLEHEHLDRHVRFSGKDDILGPRKKSCSFSEKIFSTTHLNALASQSEQDYSAEIVKHSAVAGAHASVDAPVSTGNGTVLQINKKQLPGIQHPIDMADFQRLHQEKEQHIPAKSSPIQAMIDENNSRMFAQGYQTAPNNPMYAGILRVLPTVSEVCSPHVNSQICANISMASNSRGKTIDCYEDQTRGFAAVDAFTSTRPFARPSSPPVFALAENAKRKSSFMTQSSINSVTGQALPYQSYCHLSPTVAPKLKQRAGRLGENCRDGGFCGLPLNSHGELIQLSSGGGVSFDQLKKSTMTSSSASVFPRGLADFVGEKHPIEQDVPKGQLNLQTMHESHNVHLPARFGVNDLPDTGIVDAHSLNSERGFNISAYPLDLNPSLTNIPFNQCRQYGQIQNRKGIQMTHLEKNSDNISLETAQPTMRLMGKDVAIGRSNIEMRRFEDGKFWMDKEIIQEHRPATNSLGNSILNIPIQQDRVFCEKETLPPPLRIENNQTLLHNFPNKVQEARLSHPYFNWNTTAAFQKGNFAVDRNADYQLHMSAPCPHLGRPYKGANLQESFMSSADTPGIRSQLPILSTLPDIRPTMGWRHAEIIYQQDPSSQRSPVLDFPFLHPDCSEHVSSSSFPSSSKNLPPWLLHATIQVKAASMPSQTFADANGSHHPCSTIGSNFPTALHLSPMLSYPRTSVIPYPHVRSSPGSALFVQPPVFPFSPGTNSNSSMTMSYGKKISIRDKMKSNAFGVDVFDHCQKINKRPAAGITGDMLRPTKMPNLIQDDLSTVIEVTKDNSSSEICQNIRARELHLNWEKAIQAGCSPSKYQKDGMPKLRPIKLSAGAKHILKPSWNTDQDNSRLIHSAIPFAAVADDTVLDSQKKSTMIYMF